MKTDVASSQRSPSAGRKPVDIQRLLVPLDGSDLSLKALHYTVHLAKLFDAQVDTLRVVEPVVYPEGLAMPQRSYDQDDLAMKLAREQSRAVGCRMIPDGVEWHDEVISGNPYAVIVDYARDKKIDLLVLTTHGHTGLKHFLLGSNAEKIIRHAPCPVLVVRDKEHDSV